jgi:hypothetical protein
VQERIGLAAQIRLGRQHCNTSEQTTRHTGANAQVTCKLVPVECLKFSLFALVSAPFACTAHVGAGGLCRNLGAEQRRSWQCELTLMRRGRCGRGGGAHDERS